MENVALELLNPDFVFKFAGKEYSVRKANLRQGLLYQQKVKELLDAKSASVDLQLVSYCIYLVLKETDKSITEDFVQDNAPADINILETLTTLGFMNPGQAAKAKNLLGTSQ